MPFLRTGRHQPHSSAVKGKKSYIIRHLDTHGVQYGNFTNSKELFSEMAESIFGELCRLHKALT